MKKGAGIAQSVEVLYFTTGLEGVSSDLDGSRGALKREVFFHTFLCFLV